jgi:hypothetical protein
MQDEEQNGGTDEQERLTALPVIPPELGIDPVLCALLHLAAFLDFGDDDATDPEAVAEALEHVGLYVQRLDDAALQAVEEQLDRLAKHGAAAGWAEEAQTFVEDFLYNCGLGPDDEPEDEPE